MTDKIDMSLDDIIKTNKSSRRGAKRGGSGGGRGSGRGGRGGRGGGAGRSGRGGGSTPSGRTPRGGGRGVGRNRTPRGSRSSYSRGNPEGSWKHDLYDGPKRSSVLSSGGPGKLVVSNLDFGVSDSDIQELFSEFGRLKTAAVHYDRSGRSLGTADVVFDRRTDAIKAMKQYNGVPLDGRSMHILMAASVTEVAPKKESPVRKVQRRSGGRVEKPARGGGKPARGGGGGKPARGGGKKGGGRKKEPAPTAEELDKELDTYLKSK